MELADYSVLKSSIFDDVYEPSEDTFILVDALEKDLDLIKVLKPLICIEIGSGSGVVTASLGGILKPCCYLCTDLNPIAANATHLTCCKNNVLADAVVTNLATVFQDRLSNSVDLLLCNPPYAVTPDEEVGGSNWQKATSGGEKGRKVIDRLIPIVPKLLSSKGVFYLTCIIENDIDDIERCFKEYNMEMTVVLKRKCGIELLYALRFSFKH